MKNKAATITVRERGPAERRHLSDELEFDFCEEFKEAFKTAVPHERGRFWDEDLRRWFIAPEFREATAAIALNYFSHVYLIEGTRTTDLATNASYSQASLFG